MAVELMFSIRELAHGRLDKTSVIRVDLLERYELFLLRSWINFCDLLNLLVEG